MYFLHDSSFVKNLQISNIFIIKKGAHYSLPWAPFWVDTPLPLRSNLNLPCASWRHMISVFSYHSSITSSSSMMCRS